MGHRAVERGENKLNKNGSLLNLKLTMLESIKTLHESEPLSCSLKNAVISGNNFSGDRYSSNVIACVIVIQQITYLIGLWAENTVWRDYRPVVPLAFFETGPFDGLDDPQKDRWTDEKDSEREGNHQPPGLIRGVGKKKKKHPILLFWWGFFPPTMEQISA